jgi:glutamate N-acetyltransferase / amino-acid N-acetyltransferase
MPAQVRLWLIWSKKVSRMSTTISPLAPTDVPEMPAIVGVKLATAAAGIRYKGRTDVLLAVMDKGTTVAGVFTRSKCPSAPVEWCRAKLGRGGSSKAGFARALVVNSGNANAFTGKTGKQSTALTAQTAAKAVGCSANEVFLASTGVIGEPLDATKFDGVLATLAETAAPDGWMSAASAIMTTDTFPKVATATVKLGNTKVTINGMAKGAGMIAPDMATMLSFVFTDAPLSSAVLQALLKSGVEDTFNAVTIDSDTSTSDTLLAFATGTAAASGAPKISRASDPRLKGFAKAFRDVLANLAEQVARDGEGARKLVEVIVEGATTKASARRIAMSIANSPLVKTAIAGEDANWGRVVMAVGKAGEPANRDKLSISFNGIRVARSGARDPSYNEAEVSEVMKNPKIQIKVALGLGKGRDRVLTCDLTKEYVAINGDYRS